MSNHNKMEITTNSFGEFGFHISVIQDDSRMKVIKIYDNLSNELIFKHTILSNDKLKKEILTDILEILINHLPH